jgi:hypothetical protein
MNIMCYCTGTIVGGVPELIISWFDSFNSWLLGRGRVTRS